MTLLFLCSNCFGQKKASVQSENPMWSEEIDTIIEKNNPNSLDLSKHQLFIDTTRTYVYYERTEKWNPLVNTELISITNEYLKDLYKDPQINKFNFQNFPRLWLSLKKYKGEFILYDRCDGAETSYGLNDSIFYIFGVHEPDLRKIMKVNVLNETELEIELERFTIEQDTDPLIVKIQMTERKYIYKLIMNLNDFTSVVFVTPNNYIRNFDVLVNHCPINKVIEFDEKLDD